MKIAKCPWCRCAKITIWRGVTVDRPQCAYCGALGPSVQRQCGRDVPLANIEAAWNGGRARRPAEWDLTATDPKKLVGEIVRTVNEIRRIVLSPSILLDAALAENGRHVSGIRVRKTAREIETLVKVLRRAVLETRK